MTRQEKRDLLESELAHYVRRELKFGWEVYAVAQQETAPAVIAALDAIDAWVRACYIALRQALNAVDAAPDEATWDAVTINYVTLQAAKPAVTRLQDLVQL